MIPEAEALIVAADGIRLEARVAIPQGARAGLVCAHPHPLHGGDMDSPVVVRVVEAASALGLATCRFNFRGVGQSTGSHGEGKAEQLDVEAALDHLGAVIGASHPIVLAGYSFGSVVAAAVAGAGRRLGGLILVAPPLAMTTDAPFSSLAGGDLPILVVVGSRDEYCPEPACRALAARLPGAHVAVVDGANHFFPGKLFPLGEAVQAWLRARRWAAWLEPRKAGWGRGPA